MNTMSETKQQRANVILTNYVNTVDKNECLMDEHIMRVTKEMMNGMIEIDIPSFMLGCLFAGRMGYILK